MDDPLNDPKNQGSPDLVIPESLQTLFAKPPAYGETPGENIPVQSSGGSGKRVLKLIVVLLVVIAGVISGYFVLSNYFPQYAKYVEPYLGPVLDPVLEQLQPVMDKIGLAKPVAPLPSPQPSPQGSPSPSPNLAGWQTYRNFEYGFEFRYPPQPDWNLRNISSNNIYIQPKEEESNPLGVSIMVLTGSDLSKLQQEGRETKSEVVNGLPWISYYTSSENGIRLISYYLLKNGKAYFINAPDFSEIINQILSTFKFPPDADGDGLPDDEEPKYGTNKNNPDTDGDTWPDGEEVQNGYNPLGPGKAQ